MHELSDWFSQLNLIVEYTASRGFSGWVRLFWLYVAVDFPRYVLTAVLAALVYLLWTRKRKDRADAWLTTNRPTVSVVVPILNESDTIAATVQSLVEQSYPVYEIILVDDGSTDGSAEIARLVARRHRHVRFFSAGSRMGKSAALNLGLSHARGQYVMFVDSDTTFDPYAVEKGLGRFSDPRVVAVGGNLRIRNAADSLLNEMQAIEYLTTINMGRRWKGMLGALPVISGAFGLFRTEMVRSVGGMDPGPGLDSDLTIDMQKTGGRVVFAPDANCYTNGPTSWRSLVKQRLRWSRNSVRNRWRKHRDLFQPWDANFRLRVAIIHADSILFQTFFAWLSVLYTVDVALHFPSALVAILVGNHILYATSGSSNSAWQRARTESGSRNIRTARCWFSKMTSDRFSHRPCCADRTDRRREKTARCECGSVRPR
jgi:cellulose synthase/poly-beta-1,6-N-acetylglucosamine synthase-like glycosyltransferase